MRTLPDGTFVYTWAPVSDSFLANRSLKDIDAWMEGESYKAAFAHKRYKHDATGNCPDPATFCLCMNGRVGPYPIVSLLNKQQWQRLFLRVTKGFEESGDTQHIKQFFGRLVLNRDNQELSAFPDVTPLMLAMIDAAADGQSTCQVEMHRFHEQKGFSDHYDRSKIVERIRERIVGLSSSDAALSILTLVRIARLETEISERDVLDAFVRYEGE